jgi:hypothetical protein
MKLKDAYKSFLLSEEVYPDEYELELPTRDKRVSAVLIDHLASLKNDVMRHRVMIDEKNRAISEIKDAVAREHWDKLEGIIRPQDIQSLKDMPPASDLLGDYDFSTEGF